MICLNSNKAHIKKPQNIAVFKGEETGINGLNCSYRLHVHSLRTIIFRFIWFAIIQKITNEQKKKKAYVT